MKKQEILKIAQANAERISAIEKHLFGEQPTESKQLEVGKWYLFTGHDVRFKPLMFVTGIREVGIVEFSGFNFQGKWTDSDNYSLDNLSKGYREATPEEVEEALIAEAKRRYGKPENVGYDLLPERKYSTPYQFDDWSYNSINRSLYTAPRGCRGRFAFRDGKWATIIEQDKFAELKEAHKNGAVIQINSIYNGWLDVTDETDLWLTTYEYRIKPLEEKPTEGAICKFWDDDQSVFLIGILQSIDKLHQYHYNDISGNCFKNAKPLSKSEVIELLFGKEEANER